MVGTVTMKLAKLSVETLKRQEERSVMKCTVVLTIVLHCLDLNVMKIQISAIELRLRST